MNVTNIDKSLLANSEDEYKKLVASNVDWIARSSEDVLALRKSKGHPLAKLPQDEFDEFFYSISYGNGGISGGSYRPLLKSLTIKETFDVFASFGMAMQFALDNQEAKCVDGSCQYEWGSFCSHVTCIPTTLPPT